MTKKQLRRLCKKHLKTIRAQRRMVDVLIGQRTDTQNEARAYKEALTDLLRFAENMPGFSIHPYTAKARACVLQTGHLWEPQVVGIDNDKQKGVQT